MLVQSLRSISPGSRKAPVRESPNTFLWRSPGKHLTRKILQPKGDGDSVDIVLYVQRQTKTTEIPPSSHNLNLTHKYLEDLKTLNKINVSKSKKVLILSLRCSIKIYLDMYKFKVRFQKNFSFSRDSCYVS